MTGGRWRAPGRLLRRLPRGVADRWQRSLQLRVAATTTVLVGLLAVVLGFTLLHQISRGLLDAKLRAAQQDASNGLELARAQLKVVNDTDPDTLASTVQRVIIDLARHGSPAGLFDVGVVDLESPGTSWSAGSAALSASVPGDLARLVDQDNLAYAYGQISYLNGTQVTGLILGGPVHTQHRTLALYYLFPLTAERATLALIERIVMVAGLGLVLFVVLIAVLVTRQVVGPVRLAAGTARRLADGHLEERMQVSGKDDLSLLARSFNDMAGSLQQQITKLEELSRLQQRFTSDVSHELRTPLTTVRMAADLIYGERADFGPAVARSAELLHDELERFEGLLSDLLEISRFDAGAAVLEAEAIDLRTLVERVADAVRTLADQHGSELRFNLPAVPAVADVDPRRVERILRNLLVNAIDHGAGKPIVLTLERGETTVSVTVRDHGIGLSPGEADQVFDRFWRADPSRTRRTGGTGLGLAISLEDARLHGGRITAWGRPGSGAQFRLTLPLEHGVAVVEADGADPTGEPPVAGPATAGPLGIGTGLPRQQRPAALAPAAEVTAS